MPIFTALALDKLIESGNTISMAHSRNSFDAEIQTRPVISNLTEDSRAGSLRGVSVPPKPYSESRIGIPTTRRHERVVSLPSTLDLEKGVSLRLNDKMETEISVPYRTNGSSASDITVERKDHWTDISPALYATPESTPLPDSPSSLSSSPYIINHKRRGPRLTKSFSEENVSSFKINSGENVNQIFATKDDSSDPLEALDSANNETCEENVETNLEQNSDLEDFVDPSDSVSVRSITESEGYLGTDRNLNPATPISEFFDAWEELSSESGYATPRSETDLRGMRTSLLMEIEKRKQAEEALSNMKNQWRMIQSQLSDVGLRFPEAPTTNLPGESIQVDSITYLCQQVSVSRFVSESIGRGLARTEAEIDKEAQINTKNTEITRLYDKLRYYEGVNREMCQRNQEIVETTRQLRQRKKRIHKWIWSSIAIATVTLAFSYFKTVRSSSSSSGFERKPTK